METLISTMLPALVGYFFGGRGSKAIEAIAKSVRAVVEEKLDEQVHTWIEMAGARVLEYARGDLEMLAWAELRRLGVRRSKALDLIVHELVAVAYGKLRRTINAAAAKRMPRQLGELEAATQGVLDAFKAGPIVPPLDIAERKP